MREVSEEAARIAEEAAKALVHIGGGRISGRTSILRGDRRIISLAREAKDGASLEAVGPGGQVRKAMVKAFDPRSGLVVLEAESPWEGVPEWRPGALPKIGSLAVIASRASAEGPEAALAAVRFVGGPTSWGAYRAKAHFQTDAQAFPGFSGAAVLNAEGELIGVVVENEEGNAGWILPAADWLAAADELLASGTRKSFRLGVGVMPVSLEKSRAKSAGRESGLMVSSVAPDSPAEAAGILVGDVILGIDGKAIGPGAPEIAALLGDRESALDCLSGGDRVERRVRPAEAK